MKKGIEVNISLARQLIDGFLSRTGISGKSGDIKRRYLWTDAFAVQSCFALANVLNQNSYHDYALQLIEQVHNILGKHRDDDIREGWISGLSEEEGKNHPTVNGLRIGKELPERKKGETSDQQLDWDRDGQYFHYLTRWFNALLLAFEETGEKKYAEWAAELIRAGEKFLTNKKNTPGMVWKMNIDLTQPAVESMGAHDPLEALICIYRAEYTAPAGKEKLEQFRNAVEAICRGMNWFTNDPLGIGGLLLSVKRSCDLQQQGVRLPAAIRPEFLFAAARAGLKTYRQQVIGLQQTAAFRLAFRECGMVLGVNTLYGMKEKYENTDIDIQSLENFLPLINEITEFWSKSSNRSSTNWYVHHDINAVMLTASLLSGHYPQVF